MKALFVNFVCLNSHIVTIQWKFLHMFICLHLKRCLGDHVLHMVFFTYRNNMKSTYIFLFLFTFSHNTRSTQWEDPRIALLQNQLFEQSSVETLFNTGSQTLNTAVSSPTPSGKCFSIYISITELKDLAMRLSRLLFMFSNSNL